MIDNLSQLLLRTTHLAICQRFLNEFDCKCEQKSESKVNLVNCTDDLLPK